MYLLSFISILLVIFTLLVIKNKKENETNKENFETKKRIACFPKVKNTNIPLFKNLYPDNYGINKHVPISISALNEGENYENHINYNINIDPELLPLNYMIIDKDFHTPIEGKEIIPSPPKYGLVRVDNTDYFLVETPNSIWREMVKKS